MHSGQGVAHHGLNVELMLPQLLKLLFNKLFLLDDLVGHRIVAKGRTG
jgi:hypothetical protein